MLNSVNLHGRLTADPELKITSSGTAVTSFYLAVDDGKKTNFFKENKVSIDAIPLLFKKKTLLMKRTKHLIVD